MRLFSLLPKGVSLFRCRGDGGRFLKLARGKREWALAEWSDGYQPGQTHKPRIIKTLGEWTGHSLTQVPMEIKELLNNHEQNPFRNLHLDVPSFVYGDHSFGARYTSDELSFQCFV